MNTNHLKYTRTVVITAIFILCITSCKKFVEIDPPRTSLTKPTVFQSDATANAAMLDIYYQLSSGASFSDGSSFSISFLATLLSDEQIDYTGDPDFKQFNDNKIEPNNSMVLRLWTGLYNCIYKTNAVLEGLATSTNVSESYKKQLAGEAKFIRAFCYFYLTNLWGDVPLVITTDWSNNLQIGRKPIDDVYQQIISDLLEAKSSLPADYSFSANERVRANSGSAIALLARSYLYIENWTEAENHSTLLIDDSSQYSLMNDLSSVFLTNSNEAILQWWSSFRPEDRSTFRVPSTPFYGALNSDFANSFEPGDLRNSTWVNLNFLDYYNARKYTAPEDNPPLQYSTVLRLSEQYLIRAEARARRNNISEAVTDINMLRARAGLPETSASDLPSALLIIEQERKSELFTEWGHRWFDLKRLGRAESILSPIKPGWVSSSQLLPIPESEIMKNAALLNSQNPGY